MQELRQSTIVEIKVGGCYDSTGMVPVTNLTIDGADEAEILKHGVTATAGIAGTLTAITGCDGWYILTLSASDTDTLGEMTLVIQDDSLCLPIWRDYEVVSQNYYDSKYGSDSFKVTLSSAEYTTVTSFHATGFSTFDPATDGVTLASAEYNTVTSFHATGFSTFDPATQGVTLSSAVYSSIADFKATGFSTFNPATQGVTLSSALYSSIADFKATGFSTFDPATDGVSLSSAEYTTITSFHATGFSTFNPATQGVTLSSAIYSSIADFKATGFSTFDPATDGVTLSSALYTGINDFKADVSGLSTFDPSADGVSLSSAIYTSIGAFKLTTSAIIASVSDGAYDLLAMMRIMFAALCGKVSGGSTTTITFRNSGDTINRIVATVDANGNRSAVTLNGS